MKHSNIELFLNFFRKYRWVILFLNFALFIATYFVPYTLRADGVKLYSHILRMARGYTVDLEGILFVDIAAIAFLPLSLAPFIVDLLRGIKGKGASICFAVFHFLTTFVIIIAATVVLPSTVIPALAPALIALLMNLIYCIALLISKKSDADANHFRD